MPTVRRQADTMRVAVMYDAGDIRIEERPVPAREPGDLLVRTAASGVCSGDLVPWYVRRKAPFVFGHEPAGTVVAAGVGSPFQPGERVFAHHHAPCFDCAFCRTGDYVQCATWRATSLDPGGMAEYFRVPAANVADTLALPAATSFVDASLIEPLACVVKSLRRAAPEGAAALAGRGVHVVGLGVMGLMHVALAAHFGARVTGSDFLVARRELASRLGATIVVEPGDAAATLESAERGRGPDYVVCAPGTAEALAHALEVVSPGGSVVMFSPLEPGVPFPLDQSRAYFRDLRIVASYSCGPDDTVEAMRLVAAGVVTAQALGAATFAFPAVAQAYGEMREARVTKAIVTFDPA
jgi:L-iditol 2-dehydrogenase